MNHFWPQLIILLFLVTLQRPHGVVAQKKSASVTPQEPQVVKPRLVKIGHPSRSADLYIPTSPAPKKRPLILFLHGYSPKPSYILEAFGLPEAVTDRDYLLMTPRGTLAKNDRWFWNATEVCCDFEHRQVDDAQWLSSLIDEAIAKYGADPHRIVMMGHSNGGFMSHQMACTQGQKLYGIVNLAGSSHASFETCAHTGTPHILNIHGTRDNVVHFEGGVIKKHAYVSANQVTQWWAERSACQPAATLIGRLDLTTQRPGKETEMREHLYCQTGNRVGLWVIKDGSHLPPFIEGRFMSAVLSWLFP